MARFVGIPNVNSENLNDEQIRLLTAFKENIELLTGTRGEQDGVSRAITRSDVTTRDPASPQLQAVSARGVGVTISGVAIPTLSDYQKLVSDVQRLNNDVSELRTVLVSLLTNLKE